MTYTDQDKRAALNSLRANDGDYHQTSTETGIRAETLKKWELAEREQRIEQLQDTVQDLHLQLAHNALHLAQAIDGAVDGAPLNQLSTALGTVIDRFLKIEEHLSQFREQSHEKVIRVEYKDPDGSIHNTPLWARGDFDKLSALQSRRMREALWEDGDWQDGGTSDRAGRDDVLVADPEVSDGDASLARHQNDSPDDGEHSNQRNGASHRLRERGRAGDSQYAQSG